jgi:hypothetical protein
MLSQIHRNAKPSLQIDAELFPDGRKSLSINLNSIKLFLQPYFILVT